MRSHTPADVARPVVVDGWALQQLWMFWLAPLVGAAIGALTYRWLGNLLANALDALTEKGPPRRLWLSAQSTPEGVTVYIRDNGPGFCMEALGRAGEPFYTTKTRTQGLGLGLAICDTLIRAFGGELLFANHKEGGALITLRLRAGAPGVSLQASEDSRS